MDYLKRTKGSLFFTSRTIFTDSSSKSSSKLSGRGGRTGSKFFCATVSCTTSIACLKKVRNSNVMEYHSFPVLMFQTLQQTEKQQKKIQKKPTPQKAVFGKILHRSPVAQINDFLLVFWLQCWKGLYLVLNSTLFTLIKRNMLIYCQSTNIPGGRTQSVSFPFRWTFKDRNSLTDWPMLFSHICQLLFSFSLHTFALVSLCLYTSQKEGSQRLSYGDYLIHHVNYTVVYVDI